MSQYIFDIIEMGTLAAGCLVGLLTLIYLIKYTRRTYSIAQSTRETALQAAAIAKNTEESLVISSQVLEEMRETRDAQTAPYVFAYFDQVKGEDPTKVFLVIKNGGKGQARDVQVTYNPELQTNRTDSLKHILQLTKHIPSLPPGGEIRHVFASTVNYFNAQPPLPEEYRVRTTFCGGVQKGERAVEQVISLEAFRGSRINKVEEKTEC